MNLIFANIKELLDQEEFESQFIAAPNEKAYDQLLVSLGLDLKKRERWLQIMIHQVPLSPAFFSSKNSFPPNRIQFRIVLETQINDKAIIHIPLLLLFLNQLIDLPALEFNERDREISYRYVWIIPTSQIEPLAFKYILSSMLLTISLHSDLIEALADGQTSFNDLLNQFFPNQDL